MEKTQSLNANGLPVSYTYSLTLIFKHQDQDLSYIPDALGLSAERIWKHGEVYMRPNATRGGSRQDSACLIPIYVEHTDLSEGLSLALLKLRSHSAFLQKCAADGIEAYLSVGWHGRWWNFGEWLDWRLLRDIADLRLSLDLDVYGSGSEGDGTDHESIAGE